MKQLRALLVLVSTAFALASAQAGMITSLFNTGVDAGGAVVANATPGDLHYTMISGPSGVLPIQAVSSAFGYPIPPWLGDNLLSRWIGPLAPDMYGPAGSYTYRTTFTLAASEVSSASITGQWAGDDGGGSGGIDLNGGSVAGPVTSFGAWTAFSINSGFVAGVNQLDFTFVNAHAVSNPTGLRVEMTGTLRAVPEPGSVALVALALLGLGFSTRHGKS